VRILVKLGGTLLDAPESRRRLAEELGQIQRSGVEMVVVHGGGKQMTRFLAERGVESRFVGGLRVTTPEVVDAVLKVLAGTVNHELVSAFVQAGSNAVGLSGIDACLTEAVQLDPELGAVGRPVRTNPELLRLLSASGYLPVVACVAGDREGHIYNVNADQMAVACAIGFQVDQLHFLTDVDGVRGGDGQIISSLTTTDCEELVRTGVATGGMQAKLNSASDALRGGIGQVIIAPGAFAGACGRLLAGETIGTRLMAVSHA
jgi:acetylglutamate kinase